MYSCSIRLANQSPECSQDHCHESQELSSLGANHKSPLLCYTKHKEVRTACSNTIISPGKDMNFNLTHAFKRGLRSSETNNFVWVFFFSSGLQQILNHSILKLLDEKGKKDTFTQHCHASQQGILWTIRSTFLIFCTSSHWLTLMK